MRGSEHLAVAALTSGGVLFLLNHGHLDMTAPAIGIIAAAGVGSLVPDIDHPRAWISNRIPATLLALGVTVLLGSWFTSLSIAKSAPNNVGSAMMKPLVDMTRPLLGWAWLAVALGTVLLTMGMLITSLVEHRGPTHSLTVGAGLAIIAGVGLAFAGLSPTLGLWFGWGYLSHLVTDLLTPKGCPAILWPWREGDVAAFPRTKPVSMPMKRPGVQETGTPSQITSAAADGDHGLAQPVEDLYNHVATGFASEVLAPSDSEAGKNST